MEKILSEHILIKISYCIFKIVIRKWEKDCKFLNLRGLSSENF